MTTQASDFAAARNSVGYSDRLLNIPADIDPEKVEATCTGGVLSITLPKAEKVKPIKVKVKT